MTCFCMYSLTQSALLLWSMVIVLITFCPISIMQRVLLAKPSTTVDAEETVIVSKLKNNANASVDLTEELVSYESCEF